MKIEIWKKWAELRSFLNIFRRIVPKHLRCVWCLFSANACISQLAPAIFSTWFEENKIFDATAGFYIFSLFFSGQIIAAPRSGDEPNFLEAQLLLKTFLFQWSCMVSQLVNLQVAFFSNHGVCSDFFSFFFLPCLICNWTLPGDGPRRCCPQLCVRAAVTALNTETPHDTLLFFVLSKCNSSSDSQREDWATDRYSEKP